MVLCVELDADNVPFIQLGKHQMRLDLEDLDEAYRERARKELGETPEVVQDALREMRDLISGENRLQVPLDDDKFLIKFLRPFRFNSEISFKVLKKFYKFKLKYPKFGQNLTPNSIKHVFDNEVFVFLPTRSATGSRIMLINPGTKWNPKLVSVQDLFKAVIVAIEIAMMEPKTQVAGVHVIINMEGFSLNHVYQFSPMTAKLMTDWVQECSPIRLRGIHIINQSIFFNMAYAIFKPFIGEQLKKKLRFHGTDTNSLCEIISENALPKSLGGSEEVMECPGPLMSEMFFYYENVFECHNSYRYIPEK